MNFSQRSLYQPPFNITSEIVNLIAEISAQIERYAIRLEQSDGLRLRKANRIRTIHSSLAIEGNMLNEGQVRDIINGKNVVAPVKEIQEVKNAIRTYEMFPTLDPFNEKDLLKAHSVMMEALTDDAGNYRRKGVGVFSEKGMVHMAPPANRVPILMSDLFQWLKTANVKLDKDGKNADVYCCYWNDWEGLVREHVKIKFNPDGTASAGFPDHFTFYKYDCGVLF